MGEKYNMLGQKDDYLPLSEKREEKNIQKVKGNFFGRAVYSTMINALTEIATQQPAPTADMSK